MSLLRTLGLAAALTTAATLAIGSQAHAKQPWQNGGQYKMPKPVQVQPLSKMPPIKTVKVLPAKPPKLVYPIYPIKPVGPKFPPVYPKPPVVVTPAPVIGPTYVVERPVTVVAERPVRTAGCLTKDYTADGMIIFRDLCTKEMATAIIPGTPAAAKAAAAQAAQQQASADAPSPSNFAGKTFEDFQKQASAQTAQAQTAPANP